MEACVMSQFHRGGRDQDGKSVMVEFFHFMLQCRRKPVLIDCIERLVV
jgi:hypothetical protein